MTNLPRVTVWNDYRHEKENAAIGELYPEGIRGVLANALRDEGFNAQTATLNEPQHGLTEAVLDETDVLIQWGHKAHDDVDDAIVDRVQARILASMSLIVLRSGHFSKISGA